MNAPLHISHPAVYRLVRLLSQVAQGQELSTAQAALVLGCSTSSVQRACNRGAIESMQLQVKGVKRKLSTRISAAALLCFLVKITTGDRTVLFNAIEQSCPQWLAIAKAAATAPSAADLTPARPQPAKSAPPRPAPRRRVPAVAA